MSATDAGAVLLQDDVDTEQPVLQPSQSQRTNSPEYWSSAPASHSVTHHAAFISTSTSSLQCPVSFQHCWTLAPSYIFCKVLFFTNLLCHPQSVLLVLNLRVILLLQSWDYSVCPYPWSPGPVRKTYRHICSKPSEVSQLQLLTCFLLIIYCCY